MKLVTNKFKSGGLHDKHLVASWEQFTIILLRNFFGFRRASFRIHYQVAGVCFNTGCCNSKTYVKYEYCKAIQSAGPSVNVSDLCSGDARL